MDVKINPLMNIVNVAPAESVPVEQRAAHREVIAAIRQVNESGLLGNSELRFSLDRETHRPVIRIVDRETKEVIRQVPPEYVLQLARFARELAEREGG